MTTEYEISGDSREGADLHEGSADRRRADRAPLEDQEGASPGPGVQDARQGAARRARTETGGEARDEAEGEGRSQEEAQRSQRARRRQGEGHHRRPSPCPGEHQSRAGRQGRGREVYRIRRLRGDVRGGAGLVDRDAVRAQRRSRCAVPGRRTDRAGARVPVAGRVLRRRDPDHRLRRGDHGAVPVRDHASRRRQAGDPDRTLLGPASVAIALGALLAAEIIYVALKGAELVAGIGGSQGEQALEALNQIRATSRRSRASCSATTCCRSR